MPVRVDVTVKPSRLRWWVLLLFCLVGAATTCIITETIWAGAFWSLLPWLIYTHRRAEPDISRLMFEADRIVFWNAEGRKQAFFWRGEGRLSSLFLSFQLHNDEAEQLRLIIWRDSLSDASWRAMNMAFRVAQPSLRNQRPGNEGTVQ